MSLELVLAFFAGAVFGVFALQVWYWPRAAATQGDRTEMAGTPRVEEDVQ